MLDFNIRSSESFNVFKSKALNFICPNCLNPIGVKVFTRLYLGWSHLQDRKFKHSFQDCLKSIYSCGIEVKTTACYLFHCLNYLRKTKIPLGNINPSGCLSRWLFKYIYLKYGNIYKKIWWFCIYVLRGTIKPYKNIVSLPFSKFFLK